jgi:Tfp pilus assembly protein PilX
MKLNIHSKNNQNGFVSIVVAVVLMLIVGSICLGITEVANIGSQKTVDSELSSQAEYAAESGVNDAIATIKSAGSIPSTTSCNNFTSANGLNSQLEPSPNVAYTCLLVTGQPPTLVLDVNQEQSSIIRVDPSPASQTITIQWPKIAGDGNPPINCTQNQEFTTNTGWTCPYSVLRMDYYQSTTGPNSTADELEGNTNSYFIYPTYNGSGPSSQSIPLTNTGTPSVILANCNDSDCSVKLTAPQDFNGYASLSSIYGDAGDVIISGASDSTTFPNSQYSIDSTGIDQGVLRRLQVRLQISSVASSNAPRSAVDASQGLCKQYSIAPGFEAYPGLDTPSSPALNIAALCGVAYKPVIYLYPTTAELVNVKLSYPTGLAATIPSYNPSTGWNVLAQPSGKLTNIVNGKQYPYLYWEGNYTNFNFNMSQGFVVPGTQTADFLNSELPKIGLSKSETAAFIQYWVPRMEHNKFSLIHFAGKDYTSMAKLDITPKPSSLLRVFMAEEPISQPVPVTPQTFPTFHRNGFTAVEWGGTILKQE